MIRTTEIWLSLTFTLSYKKYVQKIEVLCQNRCKYSNYFNCLIGIKPGHMISLSVFAQFLNEYLYIRDLKEYKGVYCNRRFAKPGSINVCG